MHQPGKGNRPLQKPQPQQPQGHDLFLYFGENFEPFHDMVLVECRFLEEVTGVHVPDSVKERQMTARVICTGPGRMLENGQIRPPFCKKDDYVFAMVDRGIPIKLGKRAFVLLNSSDVLGKFPDGPERPKVDEMHQEMSVTLCHCGHPENEGMIHRTDMACFPKA